MSYPILPPPAPPVGTPLVDTKGVVSTYWYEWFNRSLAWTSRDSIEEVEKGEFRLSEPLFAGQELIELPIRKGAMVTGWRLASSVLDTAGSPAITLNLGDSGSSTRYLSASPLGRVGGVAFNSANGGNLHSYAADDAIILKVGTAPGAGALRGTIRLIVYSVA